MALREILVEFGIELDKASAQKAENQVDSVTSSLKRLKQFAISAGIVMAAGQLARGFVTMLEMASDANEIANQLAAVFGEELTPAMVEFSDQTATSLGKSQSQVQKFAANIGALLKPMVGSAEAASDMSQQVTKLAFDMSSFLNLPAEEALGKLRAGLVGSSEPLLSVGIDTRQAALAQFALSRGISKSTKGMKSAEITALRLALITERLTEQGAVGDAERTAGGFANAVRGLKGAFDDLVIAMGREFIPLAEQVLAVMIPLVRSMSPGLVNAAKTVATILGRVGAAINFFMFGMTRMQQLLLVVSAAALALGIAFQTVGVSATIAGIKAAAAWLIAAAPVVLFIALLTIIIATFALIVDDLIAMGEGHESVIGTMITGIEDLIEEWGGIAPAIGEMLRTALVFWLEFFGVTEDEFDQFIQNIVDFFMGLIDEMIGGFNTAFDGLVQGITKVFKMVQRLLRIPGVGALLGPVGILGQAAVVGADIIQGATESGAVDIIQGATESGAAVGVPTSAAVMGPASAGATIVNQPRNNTTIEVDASGQSDPQAIATMVGEAVRGENERQRRQAAQAFQVAVE